MRQASKRRSMAVAVPLCIVALAMALVAGTRAAAAADTKPADPRLPVTVPHEEVLSMSGDPARPVMLEVTLFLPSGPGPFPLAIVNHGADHASAKNRGERYHYTISAYYFLSRGYAVALPMMRGFAGSGGSIALAGCDLATVAQNDARDIRAVTEALARRPEIDGSRIVVAGQSFGAWNTLGLGVSPPPGVKGLISFNAAVRTTDCHDQDNSMARAAGQLGARTTLPSLWFYGDNDSLMPVATWRDVYAHYTNAGGRAELVAFGPYGKDSHQILSTPDSLPFWGPKLDLFLARIGLPSAPVHPEYLPYPVPPSSKFAEVTDVAAVPFLGESGRATYRKFLDSSSPRAFVLAPSGIAAQAASGYDPLGRAMLACSRYATDCRPYAFNDKVVWAGPRQAVASNGNAITVVAKTVPRNVSTSLGVFYSVNPDCSSKGLSTISIPTKPGHGAAVVAERDTRPSFPQASPFSACNVAPVPAMGVTYTPSGGFAGADSLTIEETSPGGRRRLIRIDLKVL
jgi:dienelactone hydrolase